MQDLAKADFRTIKTFITNNITAERLLVDILQSSTGEKMAQHASKAGGGAIETATKNSNNVVAA